MDRGLAWLSQQPQANGTLANEAGSIATSFQARTETVVTLKQFASTANVVPVADAVAGEIATTSEYAARQVMALAPLGRDVSGVLNPLLAIQNVDGGFGFTGGYPSNPLDTAYALLAMRAASSSNTAVISKALGYLTAAQAPTDGSFGVNGQPSIFVTALALRAMNGFAQNFPLTTPTGSAKAWLVSQQTAGAYSTVLDNAIAAIALAGATLDTSAFAGAQAVVSNAQAADGSWADDPYLTALALRALAATASAPPPATTGQIAGFVVDQTTNAPLQGVQVQVSGPQSISTTSDASGGFSLANLTPGTYTLQLSKAGYTSITQAVAVTAGTASNVGTLRMQVAATTASLQGIVRDGGTGLALSGATVSVSGGSMATTDAGGAYQLSGLIPGTVTITGAVTGYQAVSLSATLTAGVVTAFSPSLYPTGQAPGVTSIAGRVVDASSGAAISGAMISAGSSSTTSNATGDFTLSNLAAGSVTIQLSAAGYVTASVGAVLAPGLNKLGDLGTVKQPASARLTGKVTDSAGSLPIGGATVRVTGTTLAGITNSNGAYVVDGITQTQLSLAISSAGYIGKNVNVTLPTLADSTVDVALDKVPPSGIAINRVTPSKPAYDPFTAVDLDVSVTNNTAQPASVRFVATILDSLGNAVIESPGVPATIAAGTAAVEIDVETHLANQAAGTYSALVRGYDLAGNLVAEGSASFVVNAATRMAGGITLDPPLVQMGTNQAVKLSASVSNHGNLPIAAGNLELTVTLLAPDTDVPKAKLEAAGSLISGGLLTSPTGGGFDRLGNFYTLNRTDMRVLQIDAQGQTKTLASLPTNLFTAKDSLVDPDGNFYVLMDSSEIWKVDTHGVFTRIRTNLSTQVTFDRDATGAFLILTNSALGARITRQFPDGTQAPPVNVQGVGSPWGVARAPDGNLYVTDSSGSSVARVGADGSVVSVATGGLLNVPHGIAFGPDGNLYIANSNGNNVLKMTLAGALSVYGTGLKGPNDLAFDAQGTLFISNGTDSTIASIPQGGGAAALFAASLVSSPQGMAYDAAGNLFIAGGSQLVKLDPSDNSTVISTSLSLPGQVAVGPAGDVYVANRGSNTITRTIGATTQPFSSGFSTLGGIATGPGGVLFATDANPQVNRVYSLDSTGQRTTVAESLMTVPQDIYVAPNGDRYVLNSTYVAVSPAAGGTVSIVARGSMSATSFAPDGSGGFYVAESTSMKRISAAGVITTTKTGLPSLGHGVVAAADGSVLLGDSTNSRVIRLDSAGNVQTFAQLTERPATLVDDLAGGVYVGSASGNLWRVTAAGAVSKVNTTGLPVFSRIAFDPIGNRIYLSNSAQIVAYDVSARTLVTVSSVHGAAAIEFSGNALLAANGTTLELSSFTPQGQASVLVAGFNAPGVITSDGTKLYFADATRIYSLVPGGTPRFVATLQASHLAWRDARLYATNGSSVQSMQPGVDSAFSNYFTLSGALRGMAFRADGALSIANETDNRVVTINAAKQVIASYTGISGPAGLAVDPSSGDLFVAMSNSANAALNKILRIAKNGKQSSPFASSIDARALAMDGSGTLHAAIRSASGLMTVVRFDAAGNPTTLASATATGLGNATPRGLSVSTAGIAVGDSGTNNLWRIAPDGTFASIAGGVVSPNVARLDGSGNLYIASQGSGSIARLSGGSITTLGSGGFLPGVTALAFSTDGKLIAGSGAFNGLLWSVDTGTGNITELGSVLNLFGQAGSVLTLARHPLTGQLYAADNGSPPRIDRLTYVPQTVPVAGTVVLSRSAAMGDLPVDGQPLNVDFGSFQPPYGGDFRLGVRVAGGAISGEAVNTLHVGPAATGRIVAGKPTLPPGDSALSVSVNVTGADFTLLSKLDATNFSVALSTEQPGGGTSFSVDAYGADAAGNVYVVSPGNGQFFRFEPSGKSTSYSLTGSSMHGAVPIDDAQNVYISGGTNGRDVTRFTIDPKAPSVGVQTRKVTLNETVQSLVRGGGDVIYALGTTGIFRIPPTAFTDSSVATTRLNFPVFSSPLTMTIDGRDNLYVLFVGDDIVQYRPDGTSTKILRRGFLNQPNFEGERPGPIAGDCGDNVFVAPTIWEAVGQLSAEEYTLVQISSRTGRIVQVLNGRSVNPQLLDIDSMQYERFTGSLLVWDDTSHRLYRAPMKCGAITTDLHLVFPAGRDVGGFNVVPTATLPRADGSTEYVWSLADVTAVGKSLSLVTTLRSLKIGDQVPVASEASLVFRNTFLPGDVTVPLSIPTVGVDGMVDIGVGLDKTQYEANTDVISTVRLANRDTALAKAGTLTVEVTDPQGTRLAIAAQQAVSIPASNTLLVTPPFNTGSYLTGSYVMRATLVDANGIVLSAGATTFDIVAGPVTLISSVTTDKQQYEAFDTVNVSARVRNVSLNAIANDVSTLVTVKDPSGRVLLSSAAPIAFLVPQALKDSPFTLKLNAAPAGTYTVEEKLLDPAGQILETRNATFTVLSSADTGSGLRGAVTATKLANVGDPVTVTVTLRNQGNAALTNVPVTIRIVNPATGQLMQWWTTQVTIAQGAQQQAVQVWSSTGATAGVYIASAVASIGGRDIAIGQDTFTLGAIQPFAFAPKTNIPLEALTQSDPVAIGGIVAPAAISVTNGEFRVNAGGWNGATGFVSPGDTVTVRIFSASQFNTKTTAVLTVAGFSAPFDVTTVNPDTTPDAFTFAPLVNVPLASLQVSNAVTITGIDIPVPISIVGGEYRINGGAFTSATSTVANGDVVEVRELASANLGTATSATLTVSTVSGTFTVTTTAEDRTPDAFAFTPQNNVPVTSLRTSNSVTIAGINVAVPVSVVGGEYSINGGPFSSAAGTVVNGATVTVRHTSSASFSTTVTTSLTVSVFTAAFESTTEGEDKSPDPIAFAGQVDVPLGVVRSSNTATVTGVNTTIPISIVGGEYSVNGAAFTNAASTVKSGDVVVVRQVSANTFATSTAATLTVSDVTAPFKVTTKSAADLTTLPTLPADGRVLVLLSCKAGFAEAADDDPTCLAQRQSFLDGYLTQLGIFHKIVTTTEDFRAESRSGRYNVYWISGGALKLQDTLAAEVREATFRGESLVVDGAHDQRNSFLDDPLGVFYKGKPTGLTTVTNAAAGILPTGSFAISGARAIRVEITGGGTRQAQFETGDPALVMTPFGLGKSLLFAFDLTGTLQAQAASILLRDTLDASMDWVTPTVSATFTGGAYVPLTLTFRNSEPVAVDLAVSATLPEGFSLAAGAPPAVNVGADVGWHLTVPAAGHSSVDWAVRTPDASGRYAIPLVVKQVYGATSVQLGTPSIPIEVRALDAALPAVVSQLQGLALSTVQERKGRDSAVSSLIAAQAAIGGARWGEAIADLLNAVDSLDAVISVPIGSYLAAIDNVMREVQRRWWAALPPCPAAAPCRTQ